VLFAGAVVGGATADGKLIGKGVRHSDGDEM